MARLFDDAQSEFLQRNQPVLTGYPFVMACKFNTNDLAPAQTLISLVDKDVLNQSFYMFLNPGLGPAVQVGCDTPAGGFYAFASSSYLLNTWHHACGLFVSATDRRAFFDGGSKGTNAQDATPANIDRTCIGVFGRSGPLHYYMSGMIAEVAIWDLSAYPGATDSDKADYFEANILPHLAAGEPPGDYTTGLESYWPLRDDDLDYEDGFDLTPYNTPSFTTHPSVLHLIDGSISAQSGADGNLQWLKELAGTIAVQSALTGDIKSILAYSLAGLIEAQSSLSAASILSTESLAGLIEIQSTVLAELQELSSLSGSIAAEAALTAKLRDLSSLSGSIGAQSSVTGFLVIFAEEELDLGGIISAHSSLTGNLIQYYGAIPPFMQKDLIDPYSGGAWLWLAKIFVPTQVTQRIAKNTEGLKYGGKDFVKSNFMLGKQKLSGDASIPRIILRIAQDNDRTFENIINATKGGEDGTVTIIRTCEKYLEESVEALQAEYDILTAGSDSTWVTFILGMPNLLFQRFPLWSYSSKVCELATPSLFKGPRCQYAGGDSTCTGLFEDCYTKGNALHWGAEMGLAPTAVRI